MWIPRIQFPTWQDSLHRLGKERIYQSSTSEPIENEMHPWRLKPASQRVSEGSEIEPPKNNLIHSHDFHVPQNSVNTDTDPC